MPGLRYIFHLLSFIVIPVLATRTPSEEAAPSERRRHETYGYTPFGEASLGEQLCRFLHVIDGARLKFGGFMNKAGSEDQQIHAIQRLPFRRAQINRVGIVYPDVPVLLKPICIRISVLSMVYLPAGNLPAAQ